MRAVQGTLDNSDNEEHDDEDEVFFWCDRSTRNGETQSGIGERMNGMEASRSSSGPGLVRVRPLTV